MLTKEEIVEMLTAKTKYITRHESQTLEYKEQYNNANLAEVMKDFVAFANNQGGVMVFGVKDRPRTPIGLNQHSIDQIGKLDTGFINGELLKAFSEKIEWDYQTIEIRNKSFTIFRISQSEIKPIITMRDIGRNHEIKEGEIYYRYGGRTQKIRASELKNIIEARIAKNNHDWVDMVTKIATSGVENAAILDLNGGTIEKGNNTVFIDEELLKKVKFIKHGSFDETKGHPTLKLIGDLIPASRVDVIHKEKLTKAYPLSALELGAEVKKLDSRIDLTIVWKLIKEEDLKNNIEFPAYVFRNDSQEKKYLSSGVVPASVPSIYNYAAVNHIVSKFLEMTGR